MVLVIKQSKKQNVYKNKLYLHNITLKLNYKHKKDIIKAQILNKNKICAFHLLIYL